MCGGTSHAYHDPHCPWSALVELTMDCGARRYSGRSCLTRRTGLPAALPPPAEPTDQPDTKQGEGARFRDGRWDVHTPQETIGGRLRGIRCNFAAQENAGRIRKGERDAIDGATHHRVDTQTKITAVKVKV